MNIPTIDTAISISELGQIEITVGQLPEWYDEAEHDFCFEDAIERRYAKANAVTPRITYSYNGEHIFQGWDKDGNLVIQRETDLNYAFDYAKANC